MGHANLTNLSTFFNRRLYAKGKLSIHECAEAAIEAKEYLNASEGDYDNIEMVCYGIEQIVDLLACAHTRGCGHYRACEHESELKYPIIVPAEDLTTDQKKILLQWEHNENGDWDFDGEGGGKQDIFDRIQWKFAPGWRKKYPEIPVIGNVTN